MSLVATRAVHSGRRELLLLDLGGSPSFLIVNWRGVERGSGARSRAGPTPNGENGEEWIGGRLDTFGILCSFLGLDA